MKKITVLFITFIMAICSLNFVACKNKPAPQSSDFVGNVFQIVVKDLGERPIATGSGFVFNEDGWFITNAHVMENAYFANAIFNIKDNTKNEAFTKFDIHKAYYIDSNKDIFIGKIENYSSIETYYKSFNFATEHKKGKTTYSVGYPNSSVELQINEGEITEDLSSLYDKLYSGISYIGSTSFIAPGSSGGILIDENYNVLGMTSLVQTDEYNNFVLGAAIDCYHYVDLINNVVEKDLQELSLFLHPNEKKFIGYFLEAKQDSNPETLNEGNTPSEKVDSNGKIGYKYSWITEDKNSNSANYLCKVSLLVTAEKIIAYEEEMVWDNGDRRYQRFYGVYSDEKGFDDFFYRFEYTFSTGSYYIITCYDINYSSIIELTLNKYEIEKSNFSVSKENINYCKERFNYIYLWLTEDIARFE